MFEEILKNMLDIERKFKDSQRYPKGDPQYSIILEDS